MSNAVRFSVRNKLFLFVVVAFSLLISLSIWQIRQQAKKASITAIENSLTQSSVILNTALDAQYYSIREVANSISKDGRVLPLVFENDSPTLQDLSLEFKDAFAFDSLFFIGDNGVVLARSDRPEAVGMNLLGRSSLFDRALAGNTTQGAIVSGGKILQIVVEPVFDNVARDVVRGAVAVAYELSQSIVNNMQKLTSGEVGLFIFTRDQAREITGVSSVYLTEPRLRVALREYFTGAGIDWQDFSDKDNQRLSIEINKEDFYSVIKPISSYDKRPLGFVMTVRSRTDLMKPFILIENSVLIIGLLCLVIAVIIALFMAYRISVPILKLVNITNDIQEGKFPKRNPPSKKPRDEIELLYNSVVKMGNSIREKNELEAYLAGLAPTLESRQTYDEADHVGDVSMQGDVPLAETLRNDDKFTSEISESLDKTIISPNLQDKLIGDNSSKHRRRAIDNVAKSEIIDKRYYLLKLVGEGIFGKVFLARDKHLGENIAIKIMDTERLRRSNVGIDMHEEIKLARRITHRNITRTYDFGTYGSFLYITMEYVEGYTLNGLVNSKGAVAFYPAMTLVKQLCAAINAAHEQGIIHRDLKPQNISINQQGVLKIMDFGLAVSIDSISEKQRDRIQRTAAGTPRFMAPEQFTGGKLDVRTDIYGLGGLTYYVFAGQPPYDAPDFEDMARLHQSGPVPSLLDVNVSIPSAIDAIVRKAMQKNPQDRFQSAKEMYDALNSIETLN